MRAPDKTKLVEIKKYLECRFDVEILANKKNIDRQLIFYTLEQLEIKDQEGFLEEVPITLHKRIFLPYEVGSEFINCWEQLESLAHELQHVIQWEKNYLSYAPNYIANLEQRANWETEALACSLELHYRCTGELYKPSELTPHLRWMNCRRTDIKKAEKMLTVFAKEFKNNEIKSLPVEEIISVL